ncbi:metallophosphoesterase, partial [candidate division WOR-3 bacterium RBG_13_43_14]
ELLDAGVDCITTGNHVWKHKEIYSYLGKEPRLLRPANYPVGAPGAGYGIYEKSNVKIAVVSIEGRVFLNRIEDPFRIGKFMVSVSAKETNNIFVDFHAEATSEKKALFFYLSGSVTAMIGTHTHVPTADEQIRDGTAYITDVGMAGVADSVIGVEKELIIQNYLTALPRKFEPAKGEVVINTVIIEFDEKTGKAISITRRNF